LGASLLAEAGAEHHFRLGVAQFDVAVNASVEAARRLSDAAHPHPHALDDVIPPSPTNVVSPIRLTTLLQIA
jgi:hypothetical protein